MVDEGMGRDEKSVITSLRKQFSTLALSIAGSWLRKDPSGQNDINLKDVADKGEIVIFSLDTSNYPELSSTLGNLIIQDLKTVSSELRQDPSLNPMHVFIDEFSSIESDNIYSLVNKSRDAGIPVTLSTQALGDLRKVGEAFLDQLLGIINAFLIHRTNTEDDAKVYAGLTGIVTRKKFRQQVEHTTSFFGIGKSAGKGAGMLEDVEETAVTITEIQQLKTGEMIYVAKGQGINIQRVIVIPEDGKLADPNNRPAPYLGAKDIPAAPSVMDVIIEEEETAHNTFTPKPVNKEKLTEIFNRPIEEVLTKVENEDKVYEKHHLPPTTTPVTVAPVDAPKPNLTIPTTIPVNRTPEVAPMPPKPTGLPPRPSLPPREPVIEVSKPVIVVKEEPVEPTIITPPPIKPVIDSEEGVNKDDFDF